MSLYPKTPQQPLAAFTDTTNLPGTTGRVTFAQTPSGMMSTAGVRDLFGSPGLRPPDSASTARKKEVFRQRRMDKAHSGRDEGGMGGMGGSMSGFAAQPVEQDLGSLRSEFDLLYPPPVQAMRGAGSGPGLVGGHRHTPAAHMDGNASVNAGGALGGGFLSPAGGGTSFFSGAGLGLGGMTPIGPANLTSMSVATPHHPHSISALQDDALPLHSMLRAAPPQDEASASDGWVTVFGFPQGFQDGVLRHLRDRGNIIESHYSGTNYLSVRLGSPETVAEVLALHGTILPADGMPGENYMIGVKKGTHMPLRKGASRQADRNVGGDASGISGAGVGGGGMGRMAGMKDSSRSGGNGGSSYVDDRTRQGGVMSGFGRFLNELLDISDLGTVP